MWSKLLWSCWWTTFIFTLLWWHSNALIWPGAIASCKQCVVGLLCFIAYTSKFCWLSLLWEIFTQKRPSTCKRWNALYFSSTSLNFCIDTLPPQFLSHIEAYTPFYESYTFILILITTLLVAVIIMMGLIFTLLVNLVLYKRRQKARISRENHQEAEPFLNTVW
jgi:hypothetical protein